MKTLIIIVTLLCQTQWASAVDSGKDPEHKLEADLEKDIEAILGESEFNSYVDLNFTDKKDLLDSLYIDYLLAFGFKLAYAKYRLEQEIIGLGAKVYLFGSRARGDFKEYSDVDFLIAAKQDLMSTIGAINERLEEENFPY